MSFEDINLHPKVLKAVLEAGYTEPTEIQLKAIPKVLKGFDIRASAQTGTGKTAAFLLPALCRLATPSQLSGRGPRVLILVPTRELAMQVAEQAHKYSKYLNRVKSVCVVGGMPYPTQMRELSKPYDILIATPGRLIDFINRKKVSFNRLEMLILDEADRMLDMGFVEPVEEIAAATPETKQSLMFSATMQGSILKLSERLLNKPMDIVVHAAKMKHDNIEQKLYTVDDIHHKNKILDHLLNEEEIKNAIVFTSTKRHADQLADELFEQGHSARALHGDMNQRRRTKTIDDLKRGKFSILVATDVAARGIDVSSITHVINFDLPENSEDYVHRIGRTGRAGNKGTALSFAAHRDTHLLKKIEKFTGHSIDVAVIEGLEPRKKADGKRPFPPRRGGKRRPNQGNAKKAPYSKSPFASKRSRKR